MKKQKDNVDDTLKNHAKILAMMCVRNTFLEELHAGIVPISKTGDFTDVKVIDGAGREIPWNELSRLDNDEMKKFMKQVVDRLYTYYVVGDDSDFQKFLGKWKAVAYQWDDPEIFNGFMSMRIKDNNA